MSYEKPNNFIPIEKESNPAKTKEEWLESCSHIVKVLDVAFVEDLIEKALPFFSKSYQEGLRDKISEIKKYSLEDLKIFLMDLKAEVAQAGDDYAGV